MGGMYSAVARLATEGAEAVGSKIGSVVGNSSFGKEASEAVERGLYHNIFPLHEVFQDNPVAKHLSDTIKGPYAETVNKLTAKGTQDAELIAKQTGLRKPSHEIVGDAHKQAQDMIFGPNRAGIQTVLKHVEKTVGKNRADIMADNLNIMFKESQDSEGLSKFDRDMRKAPPDQEGFKTPPSPYKGKNFYEKNIGGPHQRLLAYKAAIPHLSSNLNILISDGFKTYAQAVATNFNPATRKSAEAAVLATNAIGEFALNGYREKEAFENGLMKQGFAPGSVGEFLQKNIYQPGLSRVRYETLMMSAHASLLAAKEAGQHLAMGNDRMALPMLRELGLDPAKIRAQKGILLQDDIDKAYFHGTDARAFLDTGKNRSALGQRSPLFRTVFAFHNYVTSQAQFFRKVFKRQYEQGDFAGIARNIGLLGMAFPVVGATIYESERLITGEDWDHPLEHLGNRLEATPAGMAYDALAGRENANSSAKIALNTLDNLSHVAAFGVSNGYIRGAARNNLAGAMLGPDLNMFAQTVTDVVKGAKYDSKHPDALKPIARDILTDTIPFAGSALAHEALPTRADKAKGKYKKYRRPKASTGFVNPLNENYKY